MDILGQSSPDNKEDISSQFENENMKEVLYSNSLFKCIPKAFI